MTADRQQELLPPLHSLFASFLLLLVSLTNQMSCIRKRLLLITKVSRNSLISSSALNRQHKRTFSLPLELLPAPGGAFPQKEEIFFLSYWLKFIRKKEKIEENLCHLTRTEWEGLKNITDPWPFLRDQGGIDLSIISVSLSLSLSCTHFIFSHAHKQTRTAAWSVAAVPAGEASDCAMSAAMVELGFSLLPNMWGGARLKTEPGRALTCGRRQTNETHETQEATFSLWFDSYIII